MIGRANGTNGTLHRRGPWLATVFCALGAMSAMRSASAAELLLPAARAQNPDELERLRAMLAQAGAEGLEARETAVERLLGMSRPEAHRILQEHLLRTDDPEALRRTILAGLQRHLVGNQSTLFGGAAAEARRQILTGYLGALSPMWRDGGDAIEDATANPLRAAARLALQRVAARDLDAAARVLLGSVDDDGKVVVLRCLADMQQVLFARTIADFLEGQEERVRNGARRALQLLTYHDEEFQTRAQFEAWYERCGSMRYVDLVERAARMGPRPLERMRDELVRLRIDAAREFVRAHTVRTPGVDWAAIQLHTVVDDPAVLDACLEQLQQSLGNGLPAEESPAPRQAFCKALLQRFRQVAEDQVRRRALLLEVAAYLARNEETELANELVTLLVAQLQESAVEAKVAALRGLRRFPTPEVRGTLVRLAASLLQQRASERVQLTTTLGTLASRTSPRWCAPLPSDADKPEWLALVAAICRSDPQLELRDHALLLAQMLDSRDQRVPEVFGLLLDFVQDARLDTKFRSTCLIHLQAWRDDKDAADRWVRALHALLEDPARELRQLAAESLARLPEGVDAHRSEWIAASILALRNRLATEPDVTVLRAMVESLQVCGREPQMPEKAIGALRWVLGTLTPLQPEHQFRLEPLLQALATLAADARADRGQWLGACGPLVEFQKRQSLRLVLQSHAAVDLAKDVGSSDAGLAERARMAMHVLVETALFKPAREGWTSTEDLLREARDVRAALGALDTVEESSRLDKPQHRLLRLEVELATGKFQEAAQRASGWLANGNGGGGPSAMSAEQKDRMRVLAAEAQLALGKPEVAVRVLDERTTEVAADPSVLELQARIARALVVADPAAAVQLFDRTLRATAPEDVAFRARLVEWMAARLRHDPKARAATLQEAERHAGLFAAADCPAELREAFDQLRTAR